MTYNVFDATNVKDHMKVNCFFDDPPTIARYDKQKYPWLDKLTEKQLGFFWQPTEIDLTKDSGDFKNLTSHEQHIFTSNLKRQILLDSVQGRAPTIAFAPICSLPELETWIQTWTFSETIHSRSYTHIIRNVYSNPSKIFDEMLEIQEIVDCANEISDNYNRLIGLNNFRDDAYSNLVYEEGWLYQQWLYRHKQALWLCLMSVNILEGIRFYVSFACSWAFAELKKMEGNAKIIKLICRDENLHLAATQHLLKILPQEDDDFKKIKEETKDICLKMFISAAEQEKTWAEYLFKDGSMIGLNSALLSDYVEWITNKRLNGVGMNNHYKIGSGNPLPWTQKWISGGDVQQAPQEVALSSYILGGIKNDIKNADIMKGLSL